MPTARRTEIGQIQLGTLTPVTALPEPPRHSTTLLVEDTGAGDRIWNVNPDNDSVSVIDEAGTLLAEIPVGNEPWSLALRPGADEVFVTNKRDATVSVIDALTLAVAQTVSLPRASQPHGLVFDATGTHYFVALEMTATLEKRDASTHAVVDSLALSGGPRHVSIRYDDSQLFVSNFITPPVPDEHTATPIVASGAGVAGCGSPGRRRPSSDLRTGVRWRRRANQGGFRGGFA